MHHRLIHYVVNNFSFSYLKREQRERGNDANKKLREKILLLYLRLCVIIYAHACDCGLCSIFIREIYRNCWVVYSMRQTLLICCCLLNNFSSARIMRLCKSNEHYRHMGTIHFNCHLRNTCRSNSCKRSTIQLLHKFNLLFSRHFKIHRLTVTVISVYDFIFFFFLLWFCRVTAFAGPLQFLFRFFALDKWSMRRKMSTQNVNRNAIIVAPS